MATFKILIIGDIGSGKTSFFNAIVKQSAVPQEGSLELETNYKTITFRVIDQDDFKDQKADGALLFFDLTSLKSTVTLNTWKVGFSMVNPGAPIVICGSKCDAAERLYSHMSVLEMVKGYKFFYISSKTRFKIYEPFIAIARNLTGKADLYV